jgi:hypothetical protein
MSVLRFPKGHRPSPEPGEPIGYLSWWRFLLGLCTHRWEKEHEVLRYYTVADRMPSGRHYILRCLNCGDRKKVDL